MDEVYIKIVKDGPYLVFGLSKIYEKVIFAADDGTCIDYVDGKVFDLSQNPAALCRCGKSANSPFCDGTHLKEHFDGSETASFEPISAEAVKFSGKNLVLSDNEKYCALARFCDARGTIWSLITKGDEASDSAAVREANLCPSGRLVMFDKDGSPLEEKLEKSIAVIEDDGLKLSGPLWVRGGIRVESADGRSYEIRNRQTLCRCGMSSNKPFCNCAHAHNNFQAHTSSQADDLKNKKEDS